MFENNAYLSGKATEDLENLSICIYENGNLRKIRDRDELATNVFVLVNALEKLNESRRLEAPDVIFKGQCVRCLRININVF